MTSQKITGVAQ